MMMDFPFQQTVTLDGTGSGTIYLKESEFHYVVTYMSVTVNPIQAGGTLVNQSFATIYKRTSVGFITIDNTYTGNADSSSDTWPARKGEGVYCQWTGGDPGASAVFYTEGIRCTESDEFLQLLKGSL